MPGNSNAKRLLSKQKVVEPEKKSPDVGDGSSRLCCVYGASKSTHMDCERMNHLVSFINWFAIQNVFWPRDLACDDEVAQVRQFLLEVFLANYLVVKLFVHFLILRTLVQVSFQQRKLVVRLVHLLVACACSKSKKSTESESSCNMTEQPKKKPFLIIS